MHTSSGTPIRICRQTITQQKALKARRMATSLSRGNLGRGSVSREQSAGTGQFFKSQIQIRGIIKDSSGGQGLFGGVIDGEFGMLEDELAGAFGEVGSVAEFGERAADVVAEVGAGRKNGSAATIGWRQWCPAGGGTRPGSRSLSK